MKTEAPKKGFREYVADSVPYWIVIVAVVLFGLSAPHTAAVFNKLTPGLGAVAYDEKTHHLFLTSTNSRSPVIVVAGY